VSHRPEFEAAPGGLSKRAAQRLIQRAFVLAGRDRNVRQHIREADLSSVWTIEDWDIEWAVAIRRGKLDFERRLPHRPDIRATWPTADGFFAEIEETGACMLRYDGPPEARRTWDVVYAALRTALKGLLLDPVDSDGRSLV
jgi:hypothetical protein